MTSILEGASDAGPFAGEGGKTGASFERATLADGTPVVLKYATPDDWLTVATGGTNTLWQLWEAGVFDRIPAVIDHATLAMEPHELGYVIVMRDVSAWVLEEGRIVTREENKRILAASDAMYGEFWGEELPGCSLYDHYAGIMPVVSEKVKHLNTPIPGLIVRGWDMFDQVAPRDVVDAMNRILDEPARFTSELEKRPATLIQGDLRLHNLGLSPNKVLMLDWEIAGNAPPAVEFAWYLIISATRIGATREQVIDDFRDVSGDRFDPYALELALIGALARLGWNKALDIVENPDPAIQAQERADLDWWIGRVRQALDVWSPA